ncbi:hypothetical protein FACS189449_02550 [Alphaproteobacteria bacterium]|nr:hypothetical protein FACS189449_02550 [Alphaproteobacteria bacterium]
MLYRFLILFLLWGCSVRPLYYTSPDAKDANTSCPIDVDVIAGREGQKLRSYLLDTLRDIKISHKSANKHFRLKITLVPSEKRYAFSTDGDAKRVLFSYVAHARLLDENKNVLMNRQISVSISYNISHSHGEVSMSIYGRNNEALIKELSYKILENVKMVVAPRAPT